MRITRSLLTAGALIAASLGTTAFSSLQQSADEREIRRVVTDYYFNHNGDSTVLRQAFNVEHTHMLFVQADSLVDVPIPTYITRVGSAPRPAAGAPVVNKRVVLVDITGTAAVAKLELAAPNGTTTDYMSLLKIRGRWQIVNKIFSR